jgi:hypothetical protein
MFYNYTTILGNYQYAGNFLIHTGNLTKLELITKTIQIQPFNRIKVVNYLVDANSKHKQFISQLEHRFVSNSTESYIFSLNGLNFKCELNKADNTAVILAF